MNGALIRFRVMAWITGVFLVVLTGWLILGYTMWDYSNVDVKPQAYVMLWTLHGWFYFFYLITGVDLTFRMRWSLWATVGVLLAGTIPFASFVADHWVTKKVKAKQALTE